MSRACGREHMVIMSRAYGDEGEHHMVIMSRALLRNTPRGTVDFGMRSRAYYDGDDDHMMIMSRA
eukprot:13085024-Heterocapsa_arctica.AAC.1